MSKNKLDSEAFLRRTFQAPLDAIAGFLLKLGITANFITLFGLVGDVVAAYLIARGMLLAGGLVAAFMAPLDALDGALARKTAVVSKFGAFLDSVVDRYDEMILWPVCFSIFRVNLIHWELC